MTGKTIRVAVYGTGNFANKTHIPNLLSLEDVEIVAASDVNADALASTASQFEIPRTFSDAHQMLAEVEFDVLYSIVPAFVRTDVEITAASKGIHLFSEKPQAREMKVAVAINDAIKGAGVLSTVGFRERYRPLFQEARRLLENRRIIHCRFTSCRGLPAKPEEGSRSWWADFQKAGGPAFDWGVHAVDYMRFITGLDIVRSQAFYHHPDEFNQPLSCSFNMQFSNGATFALNTVSSGSKNPPGPWFTVFYEGGCLTIHHYERIEIDNETVWEWQGEQPDPWLIQDRTFIEAVRSGDASDLKSDYEDGLWSLAPILAGWHSADRDGLCVDVRQFLKGG